MAKYTSDAHAVIVRELERYTGDRLEGKKNVAVHCPWHNEKSASLYITVNPTGTKFSAGTYYCFGCQAKTSTHGGWNGLADKLGLANIDAGSDKITTYVHREVRPEVLADANEGWELQALLEHWNCGFAAPWPSHMAWRGTPGWLMRKVGALLSFDEKFEQPMCILPQWNGPVLTGAVRALCRVTAKTKPFKYMSAPGEWVKTHALWPYHTVQTMLDTRDSRDVFLVEGPRDAIRLIGCGLPALALLGTNNWSTEKRDLLLTLDPDRVFFAFDSDEAGVRATRLVMPTLKDYTHRTRITYEGDGKIDPGSVDVAQIRAWKRRWKIDTTLTRDLPDHYT